MIVYRDRWILVADKPVGLATQADRSGEPGLFEHLRDQEGELFLHHRLDRPTSGLVLFARHPSANKGITEALRSHRIERVYRAVLYGLSEGGSWHMPVQRRSAHTAISVMGTGSGLSAVECALHTGRKHQIRVQAALAGTPVVGDRRYGGEAGRAWPRLALHAVRLAFEHPVTGERMECRAPVPDDLAVLWKRAGGS